MRSQFKCFIVVVVVAEIMYNYVVCCLYYFVVYRAGKGCCWVSTTPPHPPHPINPTRHQKIVEGF